MSQAPKKHYDVFNGDADGLCALHQLRLHEPKNTVLITGVKRDISLLKQVPLDEPASIHVLDISFEKNRQAAQACLDAGCELRYFDHHKPGELIQHRNIHYHIDTDPSTCTGLIVSEHIGHRYPGWAVTALFGDNQHTAAEHFGQAHGFDAAALASLRELGTLLNYNGYGDSLNDLHLPPATLYQRLAPFTDPLAFFATDTVAQLREGYRQDNAECAALTPYHQSPSGSVYLLPNAAWARRISGDFGNALARQAPEQAHAVISHKPEGGLLVSIRAPKARPIGADTLASAFPTGGGRAAAAGINHLDTQALEAFIRAFDQAFVH